MSPISSQAIVHPWVEIREDASIDPWVVLGYPIQGSSRQVMLRIGRGAIIRSHTVVYAGSVIGDEFTTGHGALVRESNEIGDRVSIGSHAVIEHHVRLEDGVRIHTGAFIPEFSIVEAGAWVGPHVVFTNALYPLARDAKAGLRGPHLMQGSKIGANATLLPGIKIGAHSLVGAGSVVVRDVPDGIVVAGNPARVIGTIADIAAYQSLKAGLVREVE